MSLSSTPGSRGLVAAGYGAGAHALSGHASQALSGHASVDPEVALTKVAYGVYSGGTSSVPPVDVAEMSGALMADGDGVVFDQEIAAAVAFAEAFRGGSLGYAVLDPKKRSTIAIVRMSDGMALGVRRDPVLGNVVVVVSMAHAVKLGTDERREWYAKDSSSVALVDLAAALASGRRAPYGRARRQTARILFAWFPRLMRGGPRQLDAWAAYTLSVVALLLGASGAAKIVAAWRVASIRRAAEASRASGHLADEMGTIVRVSRRPPPVLALEDVPRALAEIREAIVGSKRTGHSPRGDGVPHPFGFARELVLYRGFVPEGTLAECLSAAADLPGVGVSAARALEDHDRRVVKEASDVVRRLKDARDEIEVVDAILSATSLISAEVDSLLVGGTIRHTTLREVIEGVVHASSKARSLSGIARATREVSRKAMEGFGKIQAELAVKVQLLAVNADELERVSSEAAAMSLKNTTLAETIKGLEARLEETNGRLHEAEVRVRKLDADVSVLGKEEFDDRNALRGEIVRLKGELAEARRCVEAGNEAHQDDLERMSHKFDCEIQKRRNAGIRKVQDLEDSIRTYKKEILKLRKSKNAMAVENARKRRDIDSLRDRLNALETEHAAIVQSLDSERSRLAAERNSLSARIEGMETQTGLHLEHIRDTERDMEVMESYLAARDEHIRAMETELEAVRTSMVQATEVLLANEHDALEEALVDHMDVDTDASSDMEHFESSKDAYLHGLMLTSNIDRAKRDLRGGRSHRGAVRHAAYMDAMASMSGAFARVRRCRLGGVGYDPDSLIAEVAQAIAIAMASGHMSWDALRLFQARMVYMVREDVRSKRVVIGASYPSVRRVRQIVLTTAVVEAARREKRATEAEAALAHGMHRTGSKTPPSSASLLSVLSEAVF